MIIDKNQTYIRLVHEFLLDTDCSHLFDCGSRRSTPLSWQTIRDPRPLAKGSLPASASSSVAAGTLYPPCTAVANCSDLGYPSKYSIRDCRRRVNDRAIQRAINLGAPRRPFGALGSGGLPPPKNNMWLDFIAQYSSRAFCQTM